MHKGALTPLTNQFYTLIPHDFGYKTPPLLDSVDMVKEKLEMLETLLEIEVATSIVKEERDARADEDPYDLHYEALHADIGPLDKKSEQYSLIEKYVETTHAATHAV